MAALQTGWTLRRRCERRISRGKVTHITSFPGRGGNLVLNCLQSKLLAKAGRYREGLGAAMNVATWVTPEVEYGRKLFHSALEGARSGENAFLHGKPLHLFVDESAEHALPPAALAACIGALAGYLGSRHRSASKALASATIVGAIGFAVGLAWESRRLTASIVSGAWRKVGRVRDEHWLEKNPIDYA